MENRTIISQGKEIRQCFTSENEAINKSEELKDLWPSGIGLIYGPYLDVDNAQYWEVSIAYADKTTP